MGCSRFYVCTCGSHGFLFDLHKVDVFKISVCIPGLIGYQAEKAETA